MITSMSNGQMKLVQQLIKKAKARKDSGLFVVEGMKMFREAPQERIEKVYGKISPFEFKNELINIANPE